MSQFTRFATIESTSAPGGRCNGVRLVGMAGKFDAEREMTLLIKFVIVSDDKCSQWMNRCWSRSGITNSVWSNQASRPVSHSWRGPHSRGIQFSKAWTLGRT